LSVRLQLAGVRVMVIKSMTILMLRVLGVFGCCDSDSIRMLGVDAMLFLN